MWPPIHRARRRLTGGTVGASGSPAALSELAGAPASLQPVLENVVITMGGHEIDRLRQALQRLLGAAVDRPDTPARIERALALYLIYREAPGRPRVLRRPAAISTPECWEISLEGTDRATVTNIRDAGRTGRFA